MQMMGNGPTLLVRLLEICSSPQSAQVLLRGALFQQKTRLASEAQWAYLRLLNMLTNQGHAPYRLVEFLKIQNLFGNQVKS